MGKKISPLNYIDNQVECPICLEKTSKFINLKCNHAFDIFCIQKYVYFQLKKNIEPSCPFCRDKICLKDFKKINKKWMLINYDSLYFINKKTHNINKNLNISNFINIKYNNNLLDGNIYIPIINNSTPIYYISPVIKDSILLSNNEEVINISKYFSYNETENGERLEQFQYYLDGYIMNKSYKKFLKKFFKSKYFLSEKSVIKNYDLLEKIKYSNIKMRFYIVNPNDIITINNKMNKYNKGFLYNKNKEFKCIFKIYLLKTFNNLYLINELKCINYI